MPSFTGIRRRKYYIAACTRDAIETLLTDKVWPEGWSKARVNRALAYIFDGHPQCENDTLDIWHYLETYLDKEDRADKYARLRKLLPW